MSKSRRRDSMPSTRYGANAQTASEFFKRPAAKPAPREKEFCDHCNGTIGNFRVIDGDKIFCSERCCLVFNQNS